MTAINDTHVEEFLRDLIKLSKKYRHLKEDLELAKKVLITQPINRISVRISDLGKDVEIPVFKLKKFRSIDFKGSGSRSGFRLIYSYDKDKDIVYLIEIYHKSKQSNHDKKRIKKYFEKKA